MTKAADTPALTKAFVVRTLFVAAVIVGVALVVKLADLWVLMFGAVVVAVILRAVADPIARYTPVKGGFSVLAAVLVILAALTAVGILFGREIGRQAAELWIVLPDAWATIQQRMSANPIGAQLLNQIQYLSGETSRFFALAPKIAGNVAAGLTGLLLVFVAGVFLALEPASSREGVLTMFPKEARPKMREALNACGVALQGWLRAQVVSMLLVGALVGVGLTIIGVPSPLALGVLAGMAQFVPVFGPIAAAVPALIVSALGGPQLLLLTLVLFVAVSQLEANVITPLVQKSVAAMPLVLGLFSIIAFGSLFGLPGALFATPLSLTAFTLVTILYRQNVLGDWDALAPGQTQAAKSPDAAKVD